MSGKKHILYIILALIMVLSLGFAFGYYFGTIKVQSLNLRLDEILKQLEQEVLKNVEMSEKIENIENIEKKEEITYDLETDSSLQKFVTNTKSFDNKAYIPENLEKVASSYISDSKGNSTIRKEANDALQKMGEKYYSDTGKKLLVVSAYRSYEYQVGIKSRGCPDNLCAKAGYSEHQSGLAIDFFSASTEYEWKTNANLKEVFAWLNENAHNFGFHNTYQRGVAIDGYEIEPWHWRYMEVPLATYLKENNLTIAEYYNSLQEKNG